MMAFAADGGMERMRKFGAFCRSLLPADWGQLLLLTGCCLLHISATLPWWPEFAPRGTSELWAGVNKAELTAKITHLIGVTWILLALLWTAGAAGFFLFFWGTARAARRLILWVIVPSSLAIASALYGAVAIFENKEGGLESSIFQVKRIQPLLPLLAREMGPGLDAALAAVVLLSLTAWRLARGRTELPAAFSAAAAAAPAGGATDLRKFAWAVLSLSAPAAWLFVMFGTPLLEKALWAVAGGRVPAGWIIEATDGAWRVLAVVPLALIAVWLMGEERANERGKGGWKELGRLLRPQRWEILALAVAFPLVIHWIPKILFFLGARLHWATYAHNIEFPPDWKAYLRSGRWQWDLLRFPVAALFSELAWRGYALPRFVARLGLHRGIVLLGMFWGLTYQSGKWLPVGGDAGVLITLVSSLLWGAALSYPLAWLTLRSASALPAAAVMSLLGMLSQMGGNEAQRVQGWLASLYVELALWAVLGVVLFRWFGIVAEEGRSIESRE